MAPDLTPLEVAAARAGLPGLLARAVPHDRRRGSWFRWRDGELLVSERVLELCPPTEASALLIDTIVLRRRLARVWLRTGFTLLVSGAILGLALWTGSWLRSPALIACLLAIPFHFVRTGRARLEADDEAVHLIGDPVPLVRGFNLMNQEELRVGPWRSKARPDLHERAERLARLHRLRERPEPNERLRAARARVLHDA